MHGDAIAHDFPASSASFGDLLRHYRRARALTQEMLAERSGVSARAISDLERGARSHPYRETAILLADALDLTGAERTTLLRVARRPLPAVSAVRGGAGATNLPGALTRLIGRERDCLDITHRIRDERTRLLTLTGPAGVGKTRLATAAALSLVEAYPDGVVYLDLSPVHDPALVIPALAAALELEDRGAIPVFESLRRRLRNRQMLLVLDNFEHVLPAAPLLSDLLRSSSNVQALVTSRAALRLRGESEFAVSPLRTPDARLVLPAEELARWEAIQLFVERASRVQREFRLTDDNAPAIAALCRRLDGLPLAIEFAAARIKLLSPAALLERIERGGAVLDSGARDAPPRQQTLQTALTWSHDLLGPDEQRLLRLLAVFSGGWTLEAAEAIGAESGLANPLDALSTLVTHNLVVSSETARFRLLETVREFATDQLHAAGEEDQARGAHLRYFVRLARTNDLGRLDATTWTRMAHLKREDANLRACLEWSIDRDPGTACLLLAELNQYWLLADQLASGREWYARVLARAENVDALTRARVLQLAIRLATICGDFARVRDYASAARVLAGQLADAGTMAHVLLGEGASAAMSNDPDRARSLFEESLGLFANLGDRYGIRRCLMHLGSLAVQQNNLPTALVHYERVQALSIAHNLPAMFRANDLRNLATVYDRLGRRQDAAETAVAAVNQAIEADARYTLALTRTTLARILLHGADRAAAIARASELAESLAVFWENGNQSDLAEALDVTALLLASADRPETAGQARGAAAGLRAGWATGVANDKHEQQFHAFATIESSFGETGFEQSLALGQAPSLEATVAEARSVLTSLTSWQSR